MTKFALIGAAGYVAPRHMQAIKDVGGELVAALDPHDSVGILDRYFPGCKYFREPERFDRFLSKNPVDYVTVASPNYLHDSHCLMAMRNGADVICEKPLVCNERNLDNLAEWEVKTGQRVNAILQCRLHPEVLMFVVHGKKYDMMRRADVVINYSTPRGHWYAHSWKNDVSKSGGLATNIGVHLFDLCVFLFGDPIECEMAVQKRDDKKIFGRFYLESANINWNLQTVGEPSREFKVGSDVLDLTNGFEDLHTKSYEKILSGNGFTLEDARPAIRIVEAIRHENPK